MDLAPTAPSVGWRGSPPGRSQVPLRGTSAERFAAQPYDTREHVLGGFAGGIQAADADLAPRVTDDLLDEVLALVPDVWLEPDTEHGGPDATRAAYHAYLRARLADRSAWLP